MEANALMDEVRELLDLLDFLDSLPIPECLQLLRLDRIFSLIENGPKEQNEN